MIDLSEAVLIKTVYTSRMQTGRIWCETTDPELFEAENNKHPFPETLRKGKNEVFQLTYYKETALP